jgi:hypothetical protein
MKNARWLLMGGNRSIGKLNMILVQKNFKFKEFNNVTYH